MRKKFSFEWEWRKEKTSLSSALATIGVLFLLVWFISFTNIFSLYRYSFWFFIASLLFFCISEVTSKDSVASKLLSVTFFVAAYLFFFIILGHFNLLKGPYWDFAFNILLFIFITFSAIISFAYPSPVRASIMDRIGCIMLALTIFIGALWYFTKIELSLPLIENLIALLHMESYPDYLIFFGLVGTMGVGFLIRSLRFHKEGIFAVLAEFFSSTAKFLFVFILFLIVMPFLIPSASILAWIYFNELIVLLIVVGIIAIGLSSFKVDELEIKVGPISKTITSPKEELSFVSKTVSNLSSELRIYRLLKDCELINRKNIMLTLTKDSLLIPLVDSNGVRKGMIAFGSGQYFIHTIIKDITSEFHGDLILIGTNDIWEGNPCMGIIQEIHPSAIEPRVFDKITRTINQRLDELSKWRVKKEKHKRMSRTRIKMPFIDIDVDEFSDYADIRIGPLHVRSIGGRSYVKMGPFLVIDDSSKMLTESNLIGTITDESGEKTNFAIRNSSLLFNKGSLDIYISKGSTIIYDKNIKIVFKPKSIYIKSEHFKLTLQKDRLLTLKGADIKLLIDAANGSIILKRLGGERRIYKDITAANRLLMIIEEMSVDLAREILENKALESLSRFLDELDQTFGT
ncbi:MAG: hypothetical protein ACTSSP_03280 [Candidatus Asgardarchaeia archaeon]